MTAYIGIDVAYAGQSGWAIVDGADGQVVSAGVLTEREPCAAFRKGLSAVYAAYAAQWQNRPAPGLRGAIERPYIGFNRATGLALSVRAGLWQGVLATLGCDTVELLTPSQWRKVLGVAQRPRPLAKASMLEYARLEAGWECNSSDEADAIGVALALWRRREG